MKKSTSIVIISFVLICCSSCIPVQHDKKNQIEPVHVLKNYRFNPASSLLSRIGPPPEVALQHLRELDSRKYTFYIPNKDEFEVIRNELKRLPARNLQVMKKRLTCMFFINDFLGSGMTEWITDENGRLYSFIVFNTLVLKKNISELLQWKEKTCFRNNSSVDDFKIDCGDKTSGFLYILLHESTHVVDYASGVTPFTEKAIRKIRMRAEGASDFTGGIWNDYYKTVEEMDFRKNVTFYGFSHGPKIDMADAGKIYRQLSFSPFPSLYASTNWAEDIAEMVAFYHLTQKMHLNYVIKVFKNGRTVYQVEPMKNPLVRKRFPFVKKFYRKTGDIDSF